MTLNPNKFNYNPNIQVLRGIAVLLVVLFHSYPKIFPGGYLGVDVFFVISGYLVGGGIFSLMIINQFSFKEFVFKRFARLYPAFIVMILFSIFVQIGTTLVLSKNFGVDLLAALLNVSNIRFYRTLDYFNSEKNILLHTWSLAVEWQFYIGISLIFLILWKLFKSQKFLMLGVYFLFIISFLAFSFASKHPQAIFYLTPFRLWEFLVGVIIFRNNKALVKSHHLVVLMLFSLGFHQMVNSSVPNILAVILTSIYLSSSSNRDYKNTFGKNIFVKQLDILYKFFEFLGRISYSLYLYHWPLGFLFLYVFNESRNLFVDLLYFLILFLISVLSFFFIESHKTLLIYRSKIVKQICIGLILIIFCQAYFILRFDKLKYEYREYNISKLYRIGKCFIEKESTPSINEECISNKSLIIWGDSHASSIYTGMKNLRPSQITASNCPPFLYGSKKLSDYCFRMNAYAIEFIKSNKPTNLILVANWIHYGGVTHVSESLKITIEEIFRYSPTTKVILIGNFPHWVLPLKSHLKLIQFYNNSNIDNLITSENSKYNFAYLKNHSASKLKLYDDVFRINILKQKSTVLFVSPIEHLCVSNRCLAFQKNLGSDEIILSSFDKNHLTPEISQFIVDLNLLEYL